MALSLNHVFGRRALALVGVGAATALTSWLIYLRNRYLKQITDGQESEGQPTPRRHKRAKNAPATDNKPGDSGGNNSSCSAGTAESEVENSRQTTDLSSQLINSESQLVEEEDLLLECTVQHDQMSPATVGVADLDLQMDCLPADTAVKPPAPSSGGDCGGVESARSPPIAEEETEEDGEAKPPAAALAAECGDTGARSLSADFMANRLAAMSKSDCVNIQLIEGDAAVLATCLKADAPRALQLLGRLAQFQHHLDRLSRGGELVVAVCDAFRAGGVEVRVQCLLNLVNLSGVPSNHQAILALIPDVVASIPVPRLSQYAQQLLANLALYELSRQHLVPHTAAFIDELRRQLCAGDQSADARRLKQCLTLLSNLTSDPNARRLMLAGPAGSEPLFPAPTGARQLDADPAARLAWVCLMGNLACEADSLMLVSNHGSTNSASGFSSTSLASAFISSLPALSKLAQKQRDKLKSSEKSSEYGQKVTALSKDLKSLLRQSKTKSK